MKLVIACMDTQGGVQPYRALAQQLLQDGFSLSVVAPKNFATMFETMSVDFVGLDVDLQALLESPELSGITEKRFMKSHLEAMEILKQYLPGMVQTCMEAAQDADAFVVGIGGMFLGESVAEKLGIPLIQAHVQPWTPTRYMEGMLGPTFLPNSWTHFFTRQVFWQPLRPLLNKVRRDVLSLPSGPFFGNVGRPQGPSAPVLYGYSPTFLPPPSDWSENIHVTGYWFVDATEEPDPRLRSFIESGPKPICIGFGSMSSKNAKATTELLLEAVAQSGQRAVLLSGWGGMAETDVPDNVFFAKHVPHSWLYPRVSMAIHHGGAGTTGASLRAGVPTLVVPFNVDQPFWGRKIHEAGVGPKPIPRRTLTATKLASTITSTLQDEAMLHSAAKMGQTIRQEQGLQNASNLIRQALETKEQRKAS